MKTKQEQIAEMAVIGCVRNPQAHTTEECLKCEFSDGCCNAYRHAKSLYSVGCRKLSKDSVVLTKEEYEMLANQCKNLEIKYSNLSDNYRLCKDANETLKQNIVAARKETAKEFAEKIKEKYGHYWCYLYKKDLKQMRTIIDELLKEYEV